MSLDRASLAASVALHLVAVTLLWAAPLFRDDPVLYEVVSVQIYSPPPVPAPPAEETAPPKPEDELIVETPDPEPPAEEPQPAPPEPEPEPVAPEPEPEPPPDQSEPDEPPPPDPPDPEPPADTPPPTTEPPPEDADAAAETEANEDAEEGGLDINVRQEAFSRDYPDYYANLVGQIGRCFDASLDRSSRGLARGQNHEATVSFVILKDGTTDEIGMARPSGSFVFDLAAQEAVECAGKSERLGPLPDEYPLDMLPVRFTFSPQRR